MQICILWRHFLRRQMSGKERNTECVPAGSSTVTVSRVEIWYADGSAKVNSRDITSAVNLKPWALVNGTWYEGDSITLTPKGGSSGGHNNGITFTRGADASGGQGQSYYYSAAVGNNVTVCAASLKFYSSLNLNNS